MAAVESVTVGPVAGKRVELLGNHITFKAVSSDTNGAYSLVEVVTEPGAGTPPHKQRDDDEAFFILEGSYEIQEGELAREVPAGNYAFIPRGTRHAFRNTGTTTARMLIINSPGGLHERFFAEIGVPAGSTTEPPDFQAVVESAARYGIDIFIP